MSQAQYVLPRDYLDISRLNLQHYLHREMFGYLVHPSIPTDHPKLRVADIGTGTGIWLTDLAHQLPSHVRLDALDISFESAPPKAWLPQNMTLRQWDIFTEVPEDLVGVYDIIHISLLALVLKDGDVAGVLGSILKLLKPGGYLQWFEADMLSWKIQTTSPENKTKAIASLMEISQPKDDRFNPTWIPRLPDLFRESGLTAVELDAKDPPPEMIMPLHYVTFMVYECFTRQANIPEWSEAIREAIPGALRETKAGAANVFTRYTVLGRKPLE
ncbi:hypothetical protein N7504_000870 [Penicillium tannophilum]|nr:hypothetical protein N7504_000870 [Penicillium tannophilum]